MVWDNENKIQDYGDLSESQDESNSSWEMNFPQEKTKDLCCQKCRFAKAWREPDLTYFSKGVAL